MQTYSAFSLIKHAFTTHRHWNQAWQKPEPKKQYDVVIIGHSHDLATHYSGIIEDLENGYRIYITRTMAKSFWNHLKVNVAS